MTWLKTAFSLSPAPVERPVPGGLRGAHAFRSWLASVSGSLRSRGHANAESGKSFLSAVDRPWLDPSSAAQTSRRLLRPLGQKAAQLPGQGRRHAGDRSRFAKQRFGALREGAFELRRIG